MPALSRDQRRRFDERGLVRLEGLIARADAETLADRLWGELARRHGIRHGEPATWTAERPAQLGAFQKTGAFNAMATDEVRAILDELIGRGAWIEPGGWGLPLVCCPTPGKPWALPHKVWHLDLSPAPKHPGLIVGRIFVLLAPLRPQGGGTLVAAGSHRAVEALAARRHDRMSSQEVRQALAGEHPWFADLMGSPKRGEDRIARFMGAETVANGVPLQVEEITGEPGDVWLMHPHALHNGSANVLDTPRLALTQTIYPKAWSSAY
ncbi:phytanoyl-CoA dioxygenase family protein [Phenylobacterium sp.]|uniref:phytanoyl-CoA dioxygenase family protein n=1 Tax=Phenylobacterium sp. TaxID=1871053 RepID=UPI002BA2E4FA|nr:phytanoyl-CoA dioxygenase family protein [Phenylobacterium sp.]HLZ77611.1 phytanoyl-CoA dioxygenase family protein [Phenylobacterium sp.]